MSARVQKKTAWSSETVPDLPTNDETLQQWLVTQATTHELRYALTHADDGVIWGQYDDGVWSWSSSYIPRVSPTLLFSTLQQLRLFGANAEVFVWREGTALNGRLITDKAGDKVCFDEAQLMWGMPLGEPQSNFQLMREGAQGLLHAPPTALISDPPQLMTRNYVEFDTNSSAFVCASRLVSG